MEKIIIIETTEKEQEYDVNFAMLLSHARTNPNQELIVRIGSYRCLFKVLE